MTASRQERHKARSRGARGPAATGAGPRLVTNMVCPSCGQMLGWPHVATCPAAIADCTPAYSAGWAAAQAHFGPMIVAERAHTRAKLVATLRSLHFDDDGQRRFVEILADEIEQRG